jgi:hypothetical protein
MTTLAPSPSLFSIKPLIVAALHLPDLAVARQTGIAALEDYVLTNAGVFVEAGIRGIMLQDKPRRIRSRSWLRWVACCGLGFPTLHWGSYSGRTMRARRSPWRTQ